MTKSNLKKLVDAVNKYTATSIDKSGLMEALPGLRYIPNEMVDNMVKSLSGLAGKKRYSIDQIVTHWNGHKALSFTPYMIENEVGDPVLALAHDKFLCLFRGNYFQVSKTPEGEGEIARTHCDLYDIITAKEYNDAGVLVLYIALMEMSTFVPELDFSVVDIHDTLTSLIPCTVRWWNRIPDWKDIIGKYVWMGSWDSGSADLSNLKFAKQIAMKSNGVVYGTLAMTEKELHLDVSGTGVDKCINKIRFPEDYTLLCMQPTTVLRYVTRVMLRVAGLRDDWNGFMVSPKREKIEVINGISISDNLQDIYKNIDESFGSLNKEYYGN